MAAPKTISKGLTAQQYEAFEKARQKAGLTVNQAKDELFRLFCESQGIEWPKTKQHGGSRKMTTLIEILTNTLQYDNQWEIYAEKIDGKFLPESPARFCQSQFENGGVLDGKELFTNNMYATDKMDSYLGRTDGRDEETISESDEREAAEYLIDMINEQF